MPNSQLGAIVGRSTGKPIPLHPRPTMYSMVGQVYEAVMPRELVGKALCLDVCSMKHGSTYGQSEARLTNRIQKGFDSKADASMVAQPCV